METTPSPSTYEAPTVVPMGSLVSITLAGKNNPFLDAAFAAGTPVSVITTS
jgi:hypothetical protein